MKIKTNVLLNNIVDFLIKLAGKLMKQEHLFK